MALALDATVSLCIAHTPQPTANGHVI